MEDEEYFQVIEEYFLQKRGNPVLLSPKEWVLIGEWHTQQIPKEVVLRAIDRAFERKEGKEEKDIFALSYCKRFVKSEFKKHLKSLEGKSAFASEVKNEAKSVPEFLQELGQLLSASAEQARSEGNVSLVSLLEASLATFRKEILEPFQPSSDLQRVEHQLSTIEKEIEQLLLTTISEEQMKLFKEDAMRDLKTFQEKVELSVYQEMLRRSLIKSARKLYRIPRLSLFYM